MYKSRWECSVAALHERFWLCDQCSQEMTVVWGGTDAEVTPLPTKPPDPVPSPARKIALEAFNRATAQHCGPRRSIGLLRQGGMYDRRRIEHPTEIGDDCCRFRNILVATDFSEPSRRALCEALALAAAAPCAIIGDPCVASPAQARGLWRIRPKWTWRTRCRREAYQIIAGRIAPPRENWSRTQTRRRGAAGLVSDRGAGHRPAGDRHPRARRFAEAGLGSVADELLRVAPCPVMTIGPEAEVAGVSHGARFHHILFATDFGKGSTKALPLALALARAEQAQLILLHMIPPIPSSSANLSAYAPATAAADEVAAWEGKFHREALQQLKECLPAETGLTQEVKYVVGSEFLTEGILSATKSLELI